MGTFIFLLGVFQAHAAPQATLQKCIRPTDFSNTKFVESYEACLKRGEVFCTIHKEDKDCLKIVHPSGHPFFKVTVDDIDPTIRCKILKDDVYKCIQDPVRFAASATNGNGSGPEPTPAASAAPGEPSPKPATKLVQPGEDGISNGEGTPLPAMPVMPPLPPPPKK